jgi:hypothetical protein
MGWKPRLLNLASAIGHREKITWGQDRQEDGRRTTEEVRTGAKSARGGPLVKLDLGRIRVPVELLIAPAYLQRIAVFRVFVMA